MVLVTILLSVFCASAITVGALKVTKENLAYRILEGFGDGAETLLKLTLKVVTIVNAVWLGLWLIGLVKR